MSSQPPYGYDPQQPTNPASGSIPSYGQDQPAWSYPPTPDYTQPLQQDPTTPLPGYGSSPSYPAQPGYGSSPAYPQQPTYPSQPAYSPPPMPSTPYSQPLYPGAAPSMPLPPGQPGMPPPAYAQPPYYPNMAPAMPSMPMYGAPVMVGMQIPVADPGAGLATTSLVLGIIALVFSILGLTPATVFFCGGLAFILGILGIIFGAVGRRSVTRKGQATAGLVMSIIAVGLPIVLFIVFVLVGAFAATNTQ